MANTMHSGGNPSLLQMFLERIQDGYCITKTWSDMTRKARTDALGNSERESLNNALDTMLIFGIPEHMGHVGYAASHPTEYGSAFYHSKKSLEE